MRLTDEQIDDDATIEILNSLGVCERYCKAEFQICDECKAFTKLRDHEFQVASTQLNQDKAEAEAMVEDAYISARAANKKEIEQIFEKIE